MHEFSTDRFVVSHCITLMLVYYIVIVTFCGLVVITHGEQSLVENDADEPPEDCNTNPREALDSYSTVEDFDRCAPYLLPDRPRIYIQAGAGRQWTLRENKLAFKRLRILPRVLEDVSETDLSVSVMKRRISMPIAAAPSAYQKLASFQGERDTVRAANRARTIMVLSSLSTTLIEDVAWDASEAILWMQIYMFRNRSATVDIMRRAEANGFQAFAVTVDTPMFGPLPINAMEVLEGNSRNLSAINVAPASTDVDASITWQDLAWLRNNARLPVVVKGILTPEDAIRAASSGVAAVWVSNHGARQLDYVPATIDVLPKIAEVLKRQYPSVEVYVDGGFRNGNDVFKGLALGARMVFIGRPILWGLAAGGRQGVNKVFDILRAELNKTMILAGTPNVRAISRKMIMPGGKCECHYDEL